MDLGAPVHDSRRLKILAEGLPLYGGVQLAIDTTLVSTLIAMGPPTSAPLTLTVLSLPVVRRRNQIGRPPREVAGRWVDETCRFLNLLAKTEACSARHSLSEGVRKV